MDERNELVQRLRTQRPASWDQLPDFSLYMDQVLAYIDRQIIPYDEEDTLTAAMVNNYTKSGLVPRAEGKKYSRDHLAYLTAICVLKRVMSAKDMDLLIRESIRGDADVKQGYASFCAGLDKALNAVSEDLESRSNDSLAFEAIHFALLSYAAGIASSRYVALLREQKEAAGELPTKAKKKEKE